MLSFKGLLTEALDWTNVEKKTQNIKDVFFILLLMRLFFILRYVKQTWNDKKFTQSMKKRKPVITWTFLTFKGYYTQFNLYSHVATGLTTNSTPMDTINHSSDSVHLIC